MKEISPEVLISQEDIALRIEDLARAITQDFEDEEIIVICVLKGAFMFCSDLIKKINLPIKLDFIDISSYGDSLLSSGQIKLNSDISYNIRDENVLIVEDIIDSGLSMKFLREHLSIKSPKSINVTSLLVKPDKLKHPCKIDYLGFEVDDKFVVGYGLDYAGRYRELPYIGILNAGN